MDNFDPSQFQEVFLETVCARMHAYTGNFGTELLNGKLSNDGTVATEHLKRG